MQASSLLLHTYATYMYWYMCIASLSVVKSAWWYFCRMITSTYNSTSIYFINWVFNATIKKLLLPIPKKGENAIGFKNYQYPKCTFNAWVNSSHKHPPWHTSGIWKKIQMPGPAGNFCWQSKILIPHFNWRFLVNFVEHFVFLFLKPLLFRLSVKSGLPLFLIFRNSTRGGFLVMAKLHPQS